MSERILAESCISAFQEYLVLEEKSRANTTRIYIMTTSVEHRWKIEGLGLVL